MPHAGCPMDVPLGCPIGMSHWDVLTQKTSKNFHRLSKSQDPKGQISGFDFVDPLRVLLIHQLQCHGPNAWASQRHATP